MEIKKLSNHAVELTSKTAKLIAFADSTNSAQLTEVKPDILLNANIEGIFSIDTPGEFETKETWIMSIPSSAKDDDRLDIFVINIEDINVVVLGPTVNALDKKMIEKIGIIDIAIVDFDGDIKERLKLVSEIDPRFILPVNYTAEKLTQIEKELGVKNIIEEKKVKIKSEDLSEEEYQMEMIKLL